MKPYILLFILISSSSQSQISSALLKKMETNQKIPVLIQFKQQADLSGINYNWSKEQKAAYAYQVLNHTSGLSQKKCQELLQSKNISFRSFYLVNALWTELTKETILQIAALEEVDRISYDSPQRGVPQQDPSIHLTQRAPEITWGIKRVGADQVWDLGIKGQGIVVAGEDTGVRWDVAAIKARYRGNTNGLIDHNYNWHDAIHQISPLSGNPNNPCGLNLKEPCDDNSHGTHTVGTMVGETAEHAIGMAPEAQWIGCRNMEQGNGAPSTYIECFEFFLAPYDLDGKNPKPELAPHVINNSWYCSLEEGCDTTVFPIMELVVENLRKAGVVVVVSAGNDGAACNTLRHVPAIYDGSFSVGAFHPDNHISNFSSNGPVNNYKATRIKPNVVAPGSDVLSTLPDGQFASWNGTSMAGPHVAGLVALMISANPLLAGRVETIESIIEETAEPFVADFDCFPYSGTRIPNNTYGYGLIDALKAVKKAQLYVGTIENEATAFQIYPNPVYDVLQIEILKGMQTEFVLMDALGKELKRISFNDKQHTENLSELKPGVYFIQSVSGTEKRSFVKM